MIGSLQIAISFSIDGTILSTGIAANQIISELGVELITEGGVNIITE